jgi:hypothetical protein
VAGARRRAPSPRAALPREAQVRAAPRDAQDQGRRKRRSSTARHSRPRWRRRIGGSVRRARLRRSTISAWTADEAAHGEDLAAAERFAAWAAHTPEGRGATATACSSSRRSASTR